MAANDTICAIVSALGEAAVGIIRLSGEDCYEIADKCFRGKAPLKEAPTHSINYGKIVDAQGKIIDEVLAMVMRAPRSFTGENVVEIQCHGGMLVMEKLLARILACGARLAERGEFSKRAFLNGKMDLTQAESIMDIISATNNRGLEMAIGQRFGGLRKEIELLRADLVELIAFMQADIDYPEDDIERLTNEEFSERIEHLLEELDKLKAGYTEGRIYREGLQVVLAGKPNVGKSSLLNALLKEERAIVTPIAGTTRDTISEYVVLKGVPLKIVDTAGIRETSDEIEQMGVARSRKSLESADLVLYLLEKGTQLDQEDRENLALIGEKPLIFVANKADLAKEEADLSLYGDVVSISALTGQGLDELAGKIKEKFIKSETDFSAQGAINNVRHLNSVEKAREFLQNCLDGFALELPYDLLVIDLQNAWEELGTISGEMVEEDLLDVIFSKFCLGK